MKLVKCEPPVYVTRGGAKYCTKQALVIEASKMNTTCLHVEEKFENYHKKKNFCTSFNNAAKRLGMEHLRSRIINNDVYILNSLAEES